MISNPIISFNNVSKTFGEIKAVDNVKFNIEKGEFFSILGPSGCGKTTLLRMIAGFESPDSGEIFIDGQPISNLPPNQRPVNMVFQNYAIFPHLNVHANIGFGLRKSGLSKRVSNRKIHEMLELIKLPGYGNRRSNELSGGQRQRVALARALIKQPKVLLLDEPLGALDKKLREQMQIELRILQKELGITFIFVTHDQEEALTLSDRIAVMSDGKVLEIAPPRQLYRSPASYFVANFLGNMNFFKGRVTDSIDQDLKVSVDILGEIMINSSALVKIDKTVWIGIRTENLKIHLHYPGGNKMCVQGDIGPSAYMGDRSYCYVNTLNRHKTILVSIQNGDQFQSTDLNTHQRVWLEWSKESLILITQN